MKEQVQEIKSRLDNIIVEGSAENRLVVVRMTGNRKMKDIVIDDQLFKDSGREKIQDLVQVAVNRALTEAERVNESEMRSAASGLLPGFM